MATDKDAAPDSEEEGRPTISLAVTAGSLAALGLFSPWALNIPIIFLLSQVVVISVVIWQACDPFADAAQWIGTNFRLPGSVRGATLDAIASSMPELFSGIFFVVIAMGAAGDSDAARAAAGSEGYGATVATCAGSAVYNMILIPAFCAIFISMYRKERPTIDVEPEVISRDGMWFLACEALLIVFLFQDAMHWWMGVIFLGLYAIYVIQLYNDARLYRRKLDAVHAKLNELGHDAPTNEVLDAVRRDGLRVDASEVDRLRDPDEDEEEVEDSTSILFGLFSVKLNHGMSWVVIILSTIVAAVACYWLVEVTRATAAQLNVPVFFVAVILAAAASSVPDTFLSIGAAMRGDDSGAVSNAFGSNIFDICICLSIPLLVNSYLVGWQPVALTQEGGEPIAGLVDLRILLAALTGISLLIMWHNRQLTRNKAFVLCGLYALFIGYAVAGSLGFSISNLFS